MCLVQFSIGRNRSTKQTLNIHETHGGLNALGILIGSTIGNTI
jgi:hypothetical protein